MGNCFRTAVILLLAGFNLCAQDSGVVKFDNPQAFRQALIRTAQALPLSSDSLPSVWQVTATDGSYSVSSEPVRSLLQHRDVAGARHWLQDLAGQIPRADAVSLNSTYAASTLHGILAGREFAKRAPPTDLARLQRRFNEWVRSWLERLFVGSLYHPSAWQTAFWIGVVLAIGFLAFLAYRLWSKPITYRRNPLDGTGYPERPWRGWIAAARQAAEKDDYRRAVQCAYWAGVTKLQESGNLPEDPTHTPREYLRLLSPTPGFESLATAREVLRSLTLSLERFWYGRSTATHSDYHACLKSLEALGCQVA